LTWTTGKGCEAFLPRFAEEEPRAPNLCAINVRRAASSKIPFLSTEGEQMSSGEELYLVMVVAALALFGGTLALVAWVERRWAKANGR
jgi:hypothetical protein